jgi:hypothetical protein
MDQASTNNSAEAAACNGAALSTTLMLPPNKDLILAHDHIVFDQRPRGSKHDNASVRGIKHSIVSDNALLTCQ